MNNKVSPLAPLNLTPSNSKGKVSSLAPLSAASTPSASIDTLPKLEKPKSRGSKSSTEKKKARKLKMEKLRQTKYATQIQAAWRGSKARKNAGKREGGGTSKSTAIKHFLGSYEKSMKNVYATPETEMNSEKNVEKNEKESHEVEKKPESLELSEKSPEVSEKEDASEKENENVENVTSVAGKGSSTPENSHTAQAEIPKTEPQTEETKDDPPDNNAPLSSTSQVADQTSISQDDSVVIKSDKSGDNEHVESHTVTADQQRQDTQSDLQSEPEPEAKVIEEITTSEPLAKDDNTEVIEEKQQEEDKPSPSVWPACMHDTFTTVGDSETPWPNLTSSPATSEPSTTPSSVPSPDPVLQWVMQQQQVLTRTVTWNMQANDPPPIAEVQKTLLPLNKFHIIGFGTEECERSIAKSALNPSKKIWENYVIDLVGPEYSPLRSHTLQAIHLMVFVHKSILPLITNVSSAAVACGMANTLGNKGGVGISFRIANTRMLILNTHLSAHQHKVDERNTQVWKILNELPALLDMEDNEEKNGKDVADEKTSQVKNTETSDSKEADSKDTDHKQDQSTNDSNSDNTLNETPSTPAPSTQPGSASSTTATSTTTTSNSNRGVDKINSYYDCLIVMGDMNYRINGNRKVIDKLLDANMYEVLKSNDQLTVSFNQQKLPPFLSESPVTFRPTYKFDTGSDVYDTSSKKRIPSWTDRILFKEENLQCLAYNSVPDIRISDHRPVYASFLTTIRVHHEHDLSKEKDEIAYTSESQVCTIM